MARRWSRSRGGRPTRACRHWETWQVKKAKFQKGPDVMEVKKAKFQKGPDVMEVKRPIFSGGQML
jgi:hypothetical protein